jgi:molecular chaperone GrpE
MGRVRIIKSLIARRLFMQGEEKNSAQDTVEQNNGAGSEAADATGYVDPGVEQKLAEAEAKIAELNESFLRARAEAENVRRRAQEDIARAHKFAIESFAEALVPVKDSLEMALKVETPTMESLREGVEMTLRQLTSAFEKGRLVEINPQPGEKMDPMKHQAISMVPADQDPNTVVSVLQKGYMIADRLLRPALVTVSAAKSA